MNAQDMQLLYDYNCWANGHILEAAGHVPPEQFATARLGYCELRGTLAHVCGAEQRWRLRLQGQPSAPMLSGDDVPDLAALRERWAAEQQQMRACLGALRDADLSEEFSFFRTNGSSITSTRWHAIVHMINHGTQHRAELAMLLTELGCSPGNLDLNIFVSERRAVI